MTAMPVKVLVRDPTRNTVSCVTGAFDRASATPWPTDQAVAPPQITPAASPADGQRSSTSATLACRPASSIRGGAGPAALITGPVGDTLIAGLLPGGVTADGHGRFTRDRPA